MFCVLVFMEITQTNYGNLNWRLFTVCMHAKKRLKCPHVTLSLGRKNFKPLKEKKRIPWEERQTALKDKQLHSFSLLFSHRLRKKSRSQNMKHIFTPSHSSVLYIIVQRALKTLSSGCLSCPIAGEQREVLFLICRKLHELSVYHLKHPEMSSKFD